MSKQSEYAKALNIRKEKLTEKEISSLMSANLDAKAHIMLMRNKNFKDLSNQSFDLISDEFYSLEKVDLIDYWNLLEYGRSNKKG